MNKGRPENIEEYKEWLVTDQKVDISKRTQVHYESVTDKARLKFSESNFWVTLLKNLSDYNAEYEIKTGYPLFIPRLIPKLEIKSYDSFLLKTYRKNIIENKNWPKSPENGWIIPENWFSRVNDIIRTLIEVKYLDGVEFIISKIESHCKSNQLGCEVSLEAREDGYYAGHMYTKQEIEVPRVTWDTERIIFSVEIQITTQLQEVIRKLLHKFYEERRKMLNPDINWKWDYKSKEFEANYLGHILHYVEGMIMEIRDKQKEKIP